MQGIPNLSSNAWGFQVDKYEANRVWFFVRTSGTHTGAFRFGNDTYEATGKTIQGPPEVCSYTFNKARWLNPHCVGKAASATQLHAAILSLASHEGPPSSGPLVPHPPALFCCAGWQGDLLYWRVSLLAS